MKDYYAVMLCPVVVRLGTCERSVAVKRAQVAAEPNHATLAAVFSADDEGIDEWDKLPRILYEVAKQKVCR